MPDNTEATIQVASGRYFSILNPRVEDVHIEDIAKALSRICRFGGHTKEFYSVAQHSIVMSYIIKEEDRKHALLHDAAEAYIGDVVRPLKSLLPEYKMIERRIEKVIFEAFGINTTMPPSIKAADLVLLATERDQLMPEDDTEWGCLEGVEPMQIVQFKALNSYEAEFYFMQRFHDLWRD